MAGREPLTTWRRATVVGGSVVALVCSLAFSGSANADEPEVATTEPIVAVGLPPVPPTTLVEVEQVVAVGSPPVPSTATTTTTTTTTTTVAAVGVDLAEVEQRVTTAITDVTGDVAAAVVSARG